MEALIKNSESKQTHVDVRNLKPALASKKEDPEQFDPLKKRKRGNPFKVLMGKVQKMLDHGMGKKEIVKKMVSQKGSNWDRETVTRCVDIVKDYNRKEKRKEKPDEKKSTYNYYRAMGRTAEKSEKPKRESIYDIERSVPLQSTMELLFRLAYLRDLSRFEPGLSDENAGGMPQTIDKKKANKQLNEIKAELKNREYTDGDLKSLMNLVATETDDEEAK